MSQIIKYNGQSYDSTVSRTKSDGSKSPLPLYSEYCNKSPTGFGWGYGGSGPHQLAFAILYDYTQDLKFSQDKSYDFLQFFLLRIPQEENWELSSMRLDNYIKYTRELPIERFKPQFTLILDHPDFDRACLNAVSELEKILSIEYPEEQYFKSKEWGIKFIELTIRNYPGRSFKNSPGDTFTYHYSFEAHYLGKLWAE